VRFLFDNEAKLTCVNLCSFDIDALDPAFAPGTGTPEVGGLTSMQGLEIIRGCRGLNLVGTDLVEVSPPYDTTGMLHLFLRIQFQLVFDTASSKLL